MSWSVEDQNPGLRAGLSRSSFLHAFYTSLPFIYLTPASLIIFPQLLGFSTTARPLRDFYAANPVMSHMTNCKMEFYTLLNFVIFNFRTYGNCVTKRIPPTSIYYSILITTNDYMHDDVVTHVRTSTNGFRFRSELQIFHLFPKTLELVR